MKNGTCCSDYKICDLIAVEGNKCEKLNNCEYCTKDGNTCLQCSNKFYYYNNECLKSCPLSMKQINSNRICVNKCNVDKCEACENEEKCKKCEKNYFLYENICVKMCPIGYFANRIAFNCILLKNEPYFWIYPSIMSCKGFCGKSYSVCR